MFIDTLLGSSLIKEDDPTDEEIILLPKGVKAGVDYYLVVPKSVFDAIVVDYRATEPLSEPILMTIGKSHAVNDPIWNTMLQQDYIVDHYTKLCNEKVAATLNSIESVNEGKQLSSPVNAVTLAASPKKTTDPGFTFVPPVTEDEEDDRGAESISVDSLASSTVDSVSEPKDMSQSVASGPSAFEVELTEPENSDDVSTKDLDTTPESVENDVSEEENADSTLGIFDPFGLTEDTAALVFGQKSEVNPDFDPFGFSDSDKPKADVSTFDDVNLLSDAESQADTSLTPSGMDEESTDNFQLPANLADEGDSEDSAGVEVEQVSCDSSSLDSDSDISTDIQPSDVPENNCGSVEGDALFTPPLVDSEESTDSNFQLPIFGVAEEVESGVKDDPVNASLLFTPPAPEVAENEESGIGDFQPPIFNSEVSDTENIDSSEAIESLKQETASIESIDESEGFLRMEELFDAPEDGGCQSTSVGQKDTDSTEENRKEEPGKVDLQPSTGFAGSDTLREITDRSAASLEDLIQEAFSSYKEGLHIDETDAISSTAEQILTKAEPVTDSIDGVEIEASEAQRRELNSQLLEVLSDLESVLCEYSADTVCAELGLSFTDFARFMCSENCHRLQQFISIVKVLPSDNSTVTYVISLLRDDLLEALNQGCVEDVQEVTNKIMNLIYEE